MAPVDNPAVEADRPAEADSQQGSPLPLILPVLHGPGKTWQVNMAGKTSEYTKAIEQLRSEIRFAREHAMENSKIPVGEEQLSKRDARNRFTNMSPEQRQGWIKENSLDAALDLVRPSQGQQQPEAMPGGELPLNL